MIELISMIVDFWNFHVGDAVETQAVGASPAKAVAGTKGLSSIRIGEGEDGEEGEEEDEDGSDEGEDIMALMGFAGFDTTKVSSTTNYLCNLSS